MDKETVSCEKCGSDMRKIDDSSTVGMECSNCGWGWVTTNPVITDRQTYSIFLNSNKSSVENIKLISSIANCNLITAKKLIETAPASIFSGSALEVRSIKKKLEDEDIPYSIEPEFPY